MKKNDFDKKKIKEVFDKISFDFSETRQYPWPEVVDFVEELEERKNSLDMGCGNGRHMKELAKKTDSIYGIDFSEKMLEIAKKELLLSKINSHRFSLVKGDVSNLPFKNNFFDYVICIATLHHIPTKKDRISCLNELNRVLKKKSRALLSVWSIKHDAFEGKKEKIRKNDFDVLVEWASEGLKEERFYHIFTKENLIELLKRSEVDSFDIELSSGNFYVEIRTN